MTRSLIVHLTDATFVALQLQAGAVAQSPEQTAAAALEQRFGVAITSEAEKQAARERFRRHFGAIDLGDAAGSDNERIDADLAREYADDHESN